MIVYTALAKVVLRSDPPSIILAAEKKGRPEPLSSKATFGGIAWEEGQQVVIWDRRVLLGRTANR